MGNKEINGSVSVSNDANIGGDVLVQGITHLKGGLKVDGVFEASNIKGLDNYLGYFYGVGEALRKIQQPKTGMFFVNGETNSIWVWDALTRLWIDTNRVDSGMKGMLNDKVGNSPADYVPSPQIGIKESYFYVAECEDVEANPNAKSKTITFTYFKNGAESVSVTVKKTSIISLFWNGDYWETSVVPMNVNWTLLSSLYTPKSDFESFKGNVQQFSVSSNETVNKFFKELFVVSIDDNFSIEKLYLMRISRNYVANEGENPYWAITLFRGGNNLPLYFKTTENPEGKDVLEFDLIEDGIVAKLFAVVDWSAIEDGSQFNIGNNIPLRYWNDIKYSPFINSYIELKELVSLKESVNSLEEALSSDNVVFGSDILTEQGFYDLRDKVVGDTAPSKATFLESKFSVRKSVKKGESFKLKTYTTSGVAGASYPWTLTDVNSVIVDLPNPSFTFDLLDGDVINVSEDGYLYISCNSDYLNSFSLELFSTISNVNSKIEVLTNSFNDTKLTNSTGFFLPNKRVMLSGASINQYNGYFEYAMDVLGLDYINISVAGVNIFHLCYELYAKGANYSDVDLLILSHTHDFDVSALPLRLEGYSPTDYESDVVLGEFIKTASHYTGSLVGVDGIYSADEMYAIGYDYAIKKWSELCFNLKGKNGYDSLLGKPCQIILYTYWHDARPVFNSAIRRLSKKWGLPLIKDDENIGFTKDRVHPITKQQMSRLYCNGIPWQAEIDVDGVRYGFHPSGFPIDDGLAKWNAFLKATKEEKLAMMPYIQIKRASILLNFLRTEKFDNSIRWSESLNLNNYKTQGIYYISGERLSNNDNLPISNAASGHTISGQLTVLDASLSDAERCVTQYLKLSNRWGSEGKEYVRTYNRYVDGVENWSAWKEIKQTANLNQISDEQLKSYTENGNYEGVIVNSTDVVYVSREYDEFYANFDRNELRTIPTACLFTMEVQNNYAVVEKFSEMVGEQVPHTIVQRVKFVSVNGSAVEVKRVCVEDSWSNWKKINQ